MASPAPSVLGEFKEEGSDPAWFLANVNSMGSLFNPSLSVEETHGKGKRKVEMAIIISQTNKTIAVYLMRLLIDDSSM